MSGGRLLYLTADGLLEPLGFSQVLRVLEGLSARGWRYTVASLERPTDLSRTERVRVVRERLARAGIEWLPRPWDATGGARAAARNELELCRVSVDLARTGRFAGIHARSYHGAFAALAAWVATGVPYLFDTRSYWFDERLEEGRWFTSPVRLGMARGIERQLYAHASGVVTLTELQADDVRAGRFGQKPGRVVACITTAADFEEFERRPIAACDAVPAALRELLAERLVLGIVGSINRSYLVDESLQLAAYALEANPDAHLLVLSGQGTEYERRLRAHGIAQQRYTVTRADHEAMPQWLSLIQWGLLLLQPDSPAKRASMPTKLGEFFAAGVRPIQFGCNSEVEAWVRRAGSGIVLPDVSESSLRAAALRISSVEWDAAQLERARLKAYEHFALASTLEKYDSALCATFPAAAPPRSYGESDREAGHLIGRA